MAKKTNENQVPAFVERFISPKKVQTDSGTVEQFSIDEQIKALEFFEKSKATSGKISQLNRVGFYKVVNRE